MTAVDLDALDKLRAAATEGEWIADGSEIYQSFPGLSDVPNTDVWIGETCRAEGSLSDGDADAALIVAAVNALPELLAEVRRGRALREAVDGLVDRLDRGGLLLRGELRAVVEAVDPS